MNKEINIVSVYKHKPYISGSLKVVPFLGFGNGKDIYISGEVMEENGTSRPLEGQTKWHNIIAMMRRYTGKGIGGVDVEVSYHGLTKTVTTDKYGIFRCNFTMPVPPSEEIWHKISFSVRDSFDNRNSKSAGGEVMIINYKPQFGIISDIDDTILVSYATNKLMKLRLMLLNNAHTRMPFEGVSAFYHALQTGITGEGFNPVFYVSNSEWNLYDLLYEFIEFHRIPKGPIFLRELSIKVLRPWKMREVNRNHKMEVISRLFNLYGEMKFILVGDSGQRDPEIYSEIVKRFPGRVNAIYIRDVGIADKVSKVNVLSQRIRDEFRTEMLLVKDTEAAAMHAIENGYISGEYLEYVRQEKERDIIKKSQPEKKLV